MEPKVEITKSQKFINDVAKDPTWQVQLTIWTAPNITEATGRYFNYQSLNSLSRSEMLALKEALNKVNLD